MRKRDEVVGGSARKNLQDTFRREKLLQDCGRIPVCGWIAQNCLWNPLGNHQQTLGSSRSNSVRNLLSFGHTEPAFKSIVDSGHSGDDIEPHARPSKKYDMTYAMKSIHLSRVTDAAFVEELRNEVVVLKALDHPHIVRCIETFEHRNQIFIIMEVSAPCCLSTLIGSRRLTSACLAYCYTSPVLEAVSCNLASKLAFEGGLGSSIRFNSKDLYSRYALRQ